MGMAIYSQTPPFQGYVFHHLPDLGSLCRLPASGPCRVSFQLTAHTSNNLTSSAKEITENARSLLRAAFSSTLMRYLDTQDLILGETSHEYLHDPEGVWISVIRAKHSANTTWSDYAHRLDAALLDEADTVTCLDDARLDLNVDDEHTPLPVLVIWDMIKHASPKTFVPRSVVFGAHVSEDSLVFLDFLVDSSLICTQSLEKLAAQVSVTLDTIIAAPDAPHTSPIAMPADLQSCTAGLCEPEREHVALEWLFGHAAHRPTAVAHEIYASLEKPPLLLTYHELNRQSNALAQWLISADVKVEDKVALCSGRTSFFYVAMAAILKAGACYVSIDPELPIERKKFIAEDSGARWVFTTPEDEQSFEGLSVILSTSLIDDALKKFGGDNVCRATLDGLAYLLYTSGTTGNPKGCLLNHRGLYWAMEAFCALPKPVTNPDTDKRLALASTAFDVHISEIVQSWCLGSRLVSAPRFELLTQLRKHVVEIGVTHMGMVPSMIEALLQKPDGLPIKYLVSGGEKITDSLLEKWSNLPDLILGNFYGPTETTIGCTSRRVGPNDRKENIGRPFPSCSAYVVDRELNIVPMGCPGELVIGGPLVARGYHQLPEATAKAFIDFPTPGQKAYRTGDLVRMMADHSIEIMGRIDLQVKYRGVRIETEGISSILQQAAKPMDISASTFITTHPAVTAELLVSFVAFGEATTSVAERRSTLPKFVKTDEAKELIRKLKKAVEVKLPPYQRPAYILPIEFVPLSFNGKTDNKVLAHLLRSLDMSELLVMQGGKA